jgi:GTPase SAR1 family protein
VLKQWISEVLHFCSGLPIILVGCKKDLRYDQKTIEELHKTSQKPVTPEQVRLPSPTALEGPQTDQYNRISIFGILLTVAYRVRRFARRLVPTSTLNVQQRPMRVFVRFSNMPHVPLS